MNIQEANHQLQKYLQNISTTDLARRSGLEMLKLYNHGIAGSPLLSPYKQLYHLLGLLMATPATGVVELEAERWRTITEATNAVFNHYAVAYFPTPGEEVTDAWRKACDVAMPAFLHYFNTMPLYYREQLQERIQVWFDPFSDVVRAVLGLSVAQLLELGNCIEEEYAAEIREAKDSQTAANTAHQELIAQAEKEGWSPDKLIAQSVTKRKVFLRWRSALDRAFTIDVEKFRAKHGAAAEQFLAAFTISRGEATEYFYPTDDNPAEHRPLFWSENTLFCPAARTVFLAVLRRTEKIILDSNKRDSYLRHRDKSLEKKTAAVFQPLLPTGSLILEGVCETPTGQFEHDIIINVGKTVLVVECKATKQREPLRDPDKAYTRIKDDFRNKNGIQKAYEQGERLRQRILTEERVPLYSDGKQIAEINGATEVFCICVTLEDFGIVATNLSLLLEKQPSDPYPWAVSTYALESILDGFLHEGKAFDDFLRFLSQRAQLHGFVYGTDELEFAGAFLGLGGFDEYLAQNDGKTMISLAPDMSQIFDDIDARKHGIDVPKREKPVTTDMRAELEKMLQQDRPDPLARSPERTVGRNDPCPCGSGKKFKKCHGR